MTDPTASVVEVCDVVVTFPGPRPIRALDGVSLAVRPGAFVLLRGPSGAGKSTLLALFALLDRPASGRVLFQGDDLACHSDAALARLRRRIGYIAQDFALIPSLSVEDNVTYPLIPRGSRYEERHQRARQALGRLGLADRGADRPNRLSGGEQQRVAIARALAGQPDLIVADEPTSNLDPDSAEAVRGAFAEARTAGATIVVASHDPAFEALATEAVTLAAGKVQHSPANGTA